MKKLLLLAMLAGITGCGGDEKPQREPATSGRRSAKSAPSVQGGKAEEFRAVEKPSTYSDDE